MRFVIPLILIMLALTLAACTPDSADPPITISVTRATTPAEPSSTPLPPPQPTAPVPTAVQPTNTPLPSNWGYVIQPLTLYSGSGPQFEEIGSLEAAETVRVLTFADSFMQVECPPALTGDCWFPFDPNDFFRYEAITPIALTLPDPAGLDFESVVAGAVSPDGRWHVGVLRSEAVYLLESVDPPYFYVILEVASTEDDTIWKPVAEWHAAGLGEESPPLPFHWSADGRYLDYTSTSHPDGACTFFDNMGDYLARLDTTNGQVDTLEPPYIGRILAISPDGSLFAYTHDNSLVVRDLDAAYEESNTASEPGPAPS